MGHFHGHIKCGLESEKEMRKKRRGLVPPPPPRDRLLWNRSKLL